MIKNVLLVGLGLSVGLLSGWGIWGQHSSPPTAPVSLQRLQPSSVSPPPSSLNPTPPRPVTVDWQAFRNAREKALQDNPELAAEYQELVKEASDQQKEINAAMIKADPKVAAILAKLEAQRHPPGAQ